MKKIFLPFLLLGLFAMTSCGKEDVGEAAEIEDVIVGTWEVDKFDTYDEGEVVFNANGTGTTTDNSPFTFELDGETFNEFNWEYVEGENEILITYGPSANGVVQGIYYTVGETFENQLNLSVLILNIELNRK